MIKLFRFFFLVCILLLAAFVQHNGGAKESVYLSSLQNFNASAFTGNGVLRSNLHLNFGRDRTDKERKNAISVAVNIEEKEDESVSSRKYLALSKGLHAASHTQITSLFCHYIGKSAFYIKHFTYSPSYRFLYLTLKVFRI